MAQVLWLRVLCTGCQLLLAATGSSSKSNVTTVIKMQMTDASLARSSEDGPAGASLPPVVARAPQANFGLNAALPWTTSQDLSDDACPALRAHTRLVYSTLVKIAWGNVIHSRGRVLGVEQGFAVAKVSGRLAAPCKRCAWLE
jgi:hypothetical protein